MSLLSRYEREMNKKLDGVYINSIMRTLAWMVNWRYGLWHLF